MIVYRFWHKLQGVSLVLVKVQNLCAERGYKELFSNLTFSLKAGQWLRVLGPNGSGKSSLLQILVGLLPPVSGEIFWYGKDTESRKVIFPDYDYFQNIVYLGHKLGIQNRFTVFENLKFWLAIRSKQNTRCLAKPILNKADLRSINNINSINCKNDLAKIDHVIHQALDYWDLAKLSPVFADHLSAGQTQRLALAKLALLPAKLWVLDEPCSALDTKGIELFEKLLNQHLERGGSAIIVSHVSLNLSKNASKDEDQDFFSKGLCLEL